MFFDYLFKMTQLIACLSTGKGTWSEVSSLARSDLWEKVFLVTNDFGKEKFLNQNVSFVIINPDGPIETIISALMVGLKDVKGPEVALNLSSGSGKEHMALLSALLKLGLAIRLVVPDKNGFKEV